MANKVMQRIGAWNQERISKWQERGKAPYATVASGVKDAFTVFVGGFVPFAILVILTISAGYYFNSLRGFSGDVQSVVAYGTAAIVEAGNLALFFVSSKAFWSGKPAHFVTALVLGLALTVISVVAQVLYLSNNLDQASIGQGAALLAGLPLVGSLASTATIIVTRALALHVVEFAACYVIARSSVSHKKIMQQAIEQQSEKMLLQIGEQFISFMEARMQNATVTPDRPAIEADPLKLPELPAGEGSSSAGNGNGHSKVSSFRSSKK
jgi:hypothetical protein